MRLRPGSFRVGNLVLLIPAAICLIAFRKIDFLWLEASLLVACVLFVVFAGKRLGWTAWPPVWCNSLPSLAGTHRLPVCCQD
jgi:hypothetical protein